MYLCIFSPHLVFHVMYIDSDTEVLNGLISVREVCATAM